MDCSLPDSSGHGILQARILEWVAIAFSRGSYWPRDQTWVPQIQADSLSSEPQGSPYNVILYSNKKKLSADMGYVDKSWNILLNERSHSQRTTDCTVSLIWNAQNRKDYVDRNYIALGKVGPLEELWDWGEGVKAKRVWWDFGGEGNKTVLKLWWWMINSLII